MYLEGISSYWQYESGVRLLQIVNHLEDIEALEEQNDHNQACLGGYLLDCFVKRRCTHEKAAEEPREIATRPRQGFLEVTDRQRFQSSTIAHLVNDALRSLILLDPPTGRA